VIVDIRIPSTVVVQIVVRTRCVKYQPYVFSTLPHFFQGIPFYEQKLTLLHTRSFHTSLSNPTPETTIMSPTSEIIPQECAIDKTKGRVDEDKTNKEVTKQAAQQT
jgi:hypothetical protein